MVSTLIIAYYEKELRLLAQENSKMVNFNVSVLGLDGRPHPCLHGAVTPHDVKK